MPRIFPVLLSLLCLGALSLPPLTSCLAQTAPAAPAVIAPEPAPEPAAQAADSSAPRAQTHAGFDVREAEAFLDGLFAAQMRARHIPGACLALVKDGRVVLVKGYGLADVATGRPVDPERTLFRAASVSKPFVAVSVLQQVRDGRMSLASDVNAYLEAPLPPDARFPQPITVRDLLRHTPGFEDQTLGLLSRPGQAPPPLAKALADNRPARFAAPGTVPAYSNYGVALAGLAVEHVSGLPFDRYVQERILAPLAMTRSTFSQPLPADLAEDLATGYTFDGRFRPVPFRAVTLSPAGALSTTARDMGAFLAMLQGDPQARNVLDPKDAATLTARSFGLDPRIGGICTGLYEWLPTGRRIVLHEGDVEGTSTILALSPADGLGFFAAFNSRAGDPARREIFQALLDRFFPVATPPSRPDASAAAAQALEGWYIPSRSSQHGPDALTSALSQFQVRLLPDGAVAVARGLGGRQRVFSPQGDGLYRGVADSANMAVIRSATGEVAGLAFDDAPTVEWLKIPSRAATLPFQALLAGLSLVVFASALVLWPVVFATRLGQPQAGPFLPVGPALTALLLSLAAWATAAGLRWLLADGRLRVPLDGSALAVLCLPYLTALAAALALAFWLASFGEVLAPLRRPRWGFWGRLNYTLVVLAGLATVWLFWRWNLLRFPF